jgi:hypothetical protein
VLHALGADVNKCDEYEGFPAPIIALQEGHVESVRMLVQLGADAQWLVDWVKDIEEVDDIDDDNEEEEEKDEEMSVIAIGRGVRSFSAATALNTSSHQYTLYSVAQLATHYLQRHHYTDKPEAVRDFTSRFAAAMQDSLVVAPFAAAAALETTTWSKRKLVLLATRTAVDATVAHAATEAKPIDVKVVVEVMNLIMSRDRVRDLHSLRLTCKLTRRGSFPVPSYALLELPTSVIEDFVGGSGSRHVSFRCLLRAWDLHWEIVVAALAVGEATAAEARAAATAAAAAVTINAVAAAVASMRY